MSLTEIFARSIRQWGPWAPEGLAFYVAGALLTCSLMLSLLVGMRAPSAQPAAGG